MSALSRRSLVALAWLTVSGLANAVECPLDRASYTEERSGAVIQFYPKDTSTDGITVMGLFDLRLPNIETLYQGEIAWNMGRYARPDGSIAQPCTPEAAADWPNACWLWSGPVYAIGNETASLIEEPDMAAPNILLFAEFGRSLLMNETFGTANPDLFAFDVFMLNGCPGE
ncbi:hypothetical protein [Devosia sp. SL43]|uniref:hypothetical protein n=1 Tax=Devosia sp. SL43 TaxID=2806348 RepID=UPI001F36DE12|nr:hypothetical protein [Devosia sp. SL43]UJW85092.1 hypothetical protein IM737_17035 [Devosia sp. SL43]